MWIKSHFLLTGYKLDNWYVFTNIQYLIGNGILACPALLWRILLQSKVPDKIRPSLTEVRMLSG